MFVEFGELTEVKVSKSLMPQHAESRATEGIDEEDLSARKDARGGLRGDREGR